jgi:hypothetical protein
MDPSLAIFLGVAFIITLYLTWFFSRSRTLLRRWAIANRYELLQVETRNLRRGPFFQRSSKHQAVCFITVRDQDGRERSGWLCLGDYWTGLFSDKSEVIWENELPRRNQP